MAPRSHTHWKNGAGPTCRFGTKKECDEAYALFRAELKRQYEAGLIRHARIKSLKGERDFLLYEARERARVESGGSPV